MQQSIFISYRRDDTADVAGRLYDRLCDAFGARQVFKDVDDLPAGVDFGSHILRVLPQCSVLLSLIGPQWETIVGEGGNRRLDDPHDWVRIELTAALLSPSLQVIPVLVNGATMPREAGLVESLKPLVRLHAVSLRRDPDFKRDTERLVAAVKFARETGVVLEQKEIPSGSSSEVAWSYVEDSLDAEDFREFERQFPSTPQVILAARSRRQLEAWNAVNQEDASAIARFREVPSFPALDALTRFKFEQAVQEARRKVEQSERSAAEQAAEFRRRAASAVALRVQELGESEAGGTLAAWMVQVGDKVRAGQPIAEIEVDKVAIEIVAPADGVIVSLDVGLGAVVQVGAVIAQISYG